jgi:glucose/arabinose dehydrogenase
VALLAASASCAHSQTVPPVTTPAVSPIVLNSGGNANPTSGKVLTGKDAMGDWTTDAPGVRRHLTLADLPPPFDTPSVDHGAHIIPRPDGAWPQVPPGFKIEEWVTHLDNPRKITTAPNGDIFVAESGPGRVRVLRDTHGTGKPDVNEVFATGLRQPFGIAFYPPGPNPQYVYVANTDGVVRFPYKNGDLAASGPQETVTNTVPGGGRLRGGGHWTRDLVFSPDGKKMFVSVGSLTNVSNGPNDAANDFRRANILEYTPDGTSTGIFASGIRNPVGIAIQPKTGDMWTSVNERDGLGDHLVPDYITHVKPGGFYGWPWYYMGDNQDPRHKGEHPELVGKVTVPDILLQSHSASLCLAFYEGSNFPRDYRGDIFACEHGSWNRDRRTGYKVIRVPIDRKGKSDGEYDDFVTGFVTPEGDVWGRPVGVTVASDGALLFSDDASGTIWRVVHEK